MIIENEIISSVDYNEKTGQFFWKIKKERSKIGDMADWLGNCGYRFITIKDQDYKAHRIAYLLMRGRWPKNDIHHKDDNRSNNKWDNIEHLDRASHLKTRYLRKDNSSKVQGVSWNKNERKWRAYITVNKKQIHLGYYNNFNSAVKARYRAEITYNFDRFLSESSAKQYLIEMMDL